MFQRSRKLASHVGNGDRRLEIDFTSSAKDTSITISPSHDRVLLGTLLGRNVIVKYVICNAVVLFQPNSR